MSGEGWEKRGPTARPKNSDFGTPMIQVLLSGLPTLLEKRGVLRLRCQAHRQFRTPTHPPKLTKFGLLSVLLGK